MNFSGAEGDGWGGDPHLIHFSLGIQLFLHLPIFPEHWARF